MKVKIKLPENLWEVTLDQMQRYSMIEEPTDVDLISIFLNIDKQYVFDMPQKQINELVKHINQVLDSTEKFKPTFKIDNIEFGFIPNLDEITAGELADCEKYIQETETINRAMAVLWRPIKRKAGDKYEIEKYSGTSEFGEAMRYMPYAVVSATMVFFSTLQNDLLKAILNSIKGVEHQAQLKHILAKNGIGMQTFTQSLAEIFLKLQKPVSKTFTKS